MRDEGNDDRAGGGGGRCWCRHGLARAQRLTLGQRGHAPARARGDRHARLPAERRGAGALDGPHAHHRRRRPVLHAALGHRAPARRLAHARRRGLPADPARRRASGAALRALPRPRRRAGGSTALLAISLAPTERELRRLEAAGVPIVLLDRAHDTLPCDHDRRRRRRPDGGRAPAGARTPRGSPSWATRRRTCSGSTPAPAARRLRGGAGCRRGPARAGVDRAPAARPRRRARRDRRAARARTTADRHLRQLRRAGDRGARGGTGGGRAGARRVVGHRLRQRGGRGLHRAHHGRAAAGGERQPRRRAAAARHRRRDHRVAPDAARDRRAGFDRPAGSCGSGRGVQVNNHRERPGDRPGGGSEQ